MKVNNDLPKNTLKTYKSFFFLNAEMDIVAAAYKEREMREKRIISEKGTEGKAHELRWENRNMENIFRISMKGTV